MAVSIARCTLRREPCRAIGPSDNGERACVLRRTCAQAIRPRHGTGHRCCRSGGSGGWPEHRYGICTAIRAWRRQSIEWSGTGQSRPAISIRLATRPTVWRSGRPNRTFNVRQVWMALSENVSGWPRLPLFSAYQIDLRIEPDRQRTAPFQQLVRVRPVRRTVARGGGLWHPDNLTLRIPQMNPSLRFVQHARTNAPPRWRGYFSQMPPGPQIISTAHRAGSAG